MSSETRPNPAAPEPKSSREKGRSRPASMAGNEGREADGENRQALFLFDVDGTLLRSGGAGRAAMSTSLESLYGVVDPMRGISLAGATDRSLFAQFTNKYLPDLRTESKEWEAEFHRWSAHYVPFLKENLESGKFEVRVFEGVREFINRLLDEGARLGLLTGNISVGAWLKVEAAGLEDYFFFEEKLSSANIDHPLDYGQWHRRVTRANPHSIYGHVSGDRNDLPREVDREVHGEIIIIGDTEKDIRCAQENNMVSLGVGTGLGDHSAMTRLDPDFFVERLSADLFEQISRRLNLK